MVLKERRMFIRYPCDFEVSCKILQGDVECTAQACDISAEGLGLKVAKKIEKGNDLEIWIHFKEDIPPIHTFGKIIWIKKSSDNYRAGIKFDSLHLLPLGVALKKRKPRI